MCTLVLSLEKYLYTDLKFKDVNRLTGLNVKPVHNNFIGLRIGALSILQEKYPPCAYGLGLNEAG